MSNLTLKVPFTFHNGAGDNCFLFVLKLLRTYADLSLDIQYSRNRITTKICMKLLGHTNGYGEQLDLTSARRDQVHDSHSPFFSPIKYFEVTLPIISDSLSFDDISETSRPLFFNNNNSSNCIEGRKPMV